MPWSVSSSPCTPSPFLSHCWATALFLGASTCVAIDAACKHTWRSPCAKICTRTRSVPIRPFSPFVLLLSWICFFPLPPTLLLRLHGHFFSYSSVYSDCYFRSRVCSFGQIDEKFLTTGLLYVGLFFVIKCALGSLVTVLGSVYRWWLRGRKNLRRYGTVQILF